MVLVMEITTLVEAVVASAALAMMAIKVVTVQPQVMVVLEYR